MFSDLAPLRDRPIPALAAVRERRAGYRAWPLDANDPRANEPLEPLSAWGVKGLNYYANPRNPPYWRRIEGAIEGLYARTTICRMLGLADARLARAGLRLHVHDAWRPRAVQAYFHGVWLPAELRLRRPDLNGEALAGEVARYWAAPTTDPLRPAPHETGAAVDLTIVWEDGAPLFMGALFDDATALANTDYYEAAAAGRDFSFSAEEARANRRLLYWVMTEVGFVNHPDEFWHFSWVDQAWAKVTGTATGFFGLATLSEGMG